MCVKSDSLLAGVLAVDIWRPAVRFGEVFLECWTSSEVPRDLWNTGFSLPAEGGKSLFVVHYLRRIALVLLTLQWLC